MSLRSAYSTIFTPVLTPDQPFQGRIDAAIPGNLAVGDSTTSYSVSLNGQTISSSNGVLSVSGGLSITGDLNASGGTFRGSVNISGITTVSALNVQNYMNVSGLATLSALNVQRNLNVSGGAAVSSDLTVTGTASAGLVYTTTISGLTRINGAAYIPGGNPYNWSEYPAISDVSFGAHNLSNINNVNISGGAVIDGVVTVNSQLSAANVYTNTISGVTLINGAPYVPGVDPANWATYPAVTNLDMSGSNAGNINALNVSGTSVFDGSLNVNNVATVVSDFNVSGLANLSGATIHNRLTVFGSLTASGATIQSNIVVNGSVLANAATVSNNLGVSGQAVLCNATVQNTLNVSGVTNLSTANVLSNFNVSGLATLSAATVENTLSATVVNATALTGVATINGTPFDPSGYPTLWADYPATSNVNLSGKNIFNINTLNASGFSILAGGVSVPAQATLSDLVVQNSKIHIGTDAGSISQGSNTIAIGVSAGYSSQLSGAIAIGTNAGTINQDAGTIAIGENAGNSNLNGFSIAIGKDASRFGAGFPGNIAIGLSAGYSNQGRSNIAIGTLAGNIGQYTNCIAIGENAGRSNQQFQSIAIGQDAASISQGNLGIAIGRSAGTISMGTSSIAIGTAAGCNLQGRNSIAIGSNAGFSNQGQYSIAIGPLAGSNNQPSNSIILNASSNALNATTSGFFVNPVTPSTTLSGLQVMTYNPVTSQIQQNYFIVLSGGYVGINQQEPTTTLDVFGKGRFYDTTVGAPSVGANGGAGTRLVLWPGGPTSTPYAIGINSANMWYGSLGSHTWYNGTQSNMGLDTTGTLTLRNNLIIDSPYTHIRTNAGNTYGYIWSRYPEGGDAMNIANNYYIDSNATQRIFNPGFGTANLQVGHGYFNFTVGPLNTAPTSNALYIGSDARVGVNTTTPGYTLDVSGDMRVTGTIFGTVTTNGYVWSYGRVQSAARSGQLIFVGTDSTWTNSTYIGWDTDISPSYSLVSPLPLTVASANSAVYSSTYWTCPFNGYYRITAYLQLDDTGLFAIGINDRVAMGPLGQSSGYILAHIGMNCAYTAQTVSIVQYLSSGDKVNVGLIDGAGDGRSTIYLGTLTIECLRRT